MKLHGTPTSPYVRRVRIVADELGVPLELVETVSPAGQDRLRALSPLWKVPTLELDGGEVVFDSHVIITHLLGAHGHGPLRPAVDVGAPGWAREQNLMTATDTMLDAAINVFYFDREGVDPGPASYLAKQRERVVSILGWIESQLDGPWLTGDPRLGVAEVMLISTLDWLVFRDRYPVDSRPAFAAFRAAHVDRPSIRSTIPVQ